MLNHQTVKMVIFFIFQECLRNYLSLQIQSEKSNHIIYYPWRQPMSRKSKHPDINSRLVQKEEVDEGLRQQLQLYKKLMAPQLDELNRDENFKAFCQAQQSQRPNHLTNAPQAGIFTHQSSPQSKMIEKKEHAEQPIGSKNHQASSESKVPETTTELRFASVSKEEDLALDIENEESFQQKLKEFDF